MLLHASLPVHLSGSIVWTITPLTQYVIYHIHTAGWGGCYTSNCPLFKQSTTMLLSCVRHNCFTRCNSCRWIFISGLFILNTCTPPHFNGQKPIVNKKVTKLCASFLQWVIAMWLCANNAALGGPWVYSLRFTFAFVLCTSLFRLFPLQCCIWVEF